MLGSVLRKKDCLKVLVKGLRRNPDSPLNDLVDIKDMKILEDLWSCGVATLHVSLLARV